MKLKMILAASLLLSVASASATGLNTFALTPQVSVDGKGAATAQLPIKVPAAPMAPKLSLSYNSQSGGNYLGQGWMLQGPTAIQLTGLNKRLDNTWSNIALDSEDLGYSQSNRYSLNGVRLVNVKGDYGKPETEYQTTLKAPHKIISHGTCGNGPCTFDVYEANGTISHYASNIAPGGSDVLVWGLTSQTDTHGNSITWEYENPKDYNVLYPKSVSYGKAGAIRKITFRYRKKHREVEVPAHIGLGGYVFHADLLLVGVDAYLNDKRLYTYNLDYTEYDYYRHSLLTNVTLCAASGECYSPLTLRYDAPTPGTQPNVAFTPNGDLDMGQAPDSPSELRVLIWDKYGDGYPGIGLLTNVNGRAIFTFARSREDGTLYLASDREDLGDWSSDEAGKHPYSWFVMDTNGDGLNDLVKIHKGRASGTLATVYEAQTGASGFVGQSRDTHLDNAWKDGRRFYTTDVNGDGRRDILSSEKVDGVQHLMAWFASEDGLGFDDAYDINRNISGGMVLDEKDRLHFTDINADSLTDLLITRVKDGRFLVGSVYNKSAKFSAPAGAYAGFADLGSAAKDDKLPLYSFLDFNRDGLTDMLRVNQTSGQAIAELYLNTGKAYNQMLAAAGSTQNTARNFQLQHPQSTDDELHTMQFVDVDGDRASDLLMYNKDEKWYDIYRHTDATYTYLTHTTGVGDNISAVLAPFGGSPLADLIAVHNEGGHVILRLWTNTTPYYSFSLTNMANGSGHHAWKFSYRNHASPVVTDQKGVEFPNIPLTKVRNVVDSWDIVLDENTTREVKRHFKMTYEAPVYNRHDWRFAGYRYVTREDPAKGLITATEYYVNYPLRGKEASVTLLTKDRRPLQVTKTSYAPHKVLESKPAVWLVPMDTRTQTVYSDNGEVAWTQNVKNFHVSEYGSPTLSGTWYTGGEVLYTANLYKDFNDGTWGRDLRVGQLKTSSKNNAEAFLSTPKTYYPTEEDLSLSFQVRDDKFRIILDQAWSAVNKGYRSEKKSYDAQGLITKRVQIEEFNNRAELSKHGRIVVDYSYDVFGNLSSREAGGLIDRFTYDPVWGLVTSHTLPDGSSTQSDYDDFGHILKQSVMNSEGSQVPVRWYDYVFMDNSRARSEHVSDGTGVIVNDTYYNSLGNVWKKVRTRGENEPVTLSEKYFDAGTGRLSHEVTPAGGTIRYTYDHRGNILTRERVGLATVRYTYAYANGKSVTSIYGPDPSKPIQDPTATVLLKTTEESKVHRERITTRSDGSKSVTHYDLLSRVTDTTDYRGLRSTVSYDTTGDRACVMTPDAGRQCEFYNGFGKLARQVNADGSEQVWSYDERARVTAMTYRGTDQKERTITYIYDDIRSSNNNRGHLTQVLDNGNAVELTYDITGFLKSKTWKVKDGEYVFTFDRYLNGSLQTVHYPQGEAVTYIYGDAGLVTSLEVSSPYWKDAVTLDFSNFLPDDSPGTILAMGYEIDRELDAWGRDTRLTLTSDSDKSVLEDVAYAWDATGNLVGMKRDGDHQRYRYDSLARLVGYSGTLSGGFEYDSNGNVTKNEYGTFVMERDTNRIDTLNYGKEDLKAHYDKAGRMTFDGEVTYTYNVMGRLAETEHMGETHTFGYFNGKRLFSDGTLYLGEGYEVTPEGAQIRVGSGQATYLLAKSSEALLVFPDRLNNWLTIVNDKSRESWVYRPYGDSQEK